MSAKEKANCLGHKDERHRSDTVGAEGTTDCLSRRNDRRLVGWLIGGHRRDSCLLGPQSSGHRDVVDRRLYGAEERADCFADG